LFVGQGRTSSRDHRGRFCKEQRGHLCAIFAARGHRWFDVRRMASPSMGPSFPKLEMNNAPRPLVAAGSLLGIGMGGFLDGIVFHQLLQTHNMLSAKYPPRNLVNLEVNMFWDGLFHMFTWLMTAAGILLLWYTLNRAPTALSSRAFVGSLAFGWGLFNLVEGIINHHVLELHHVREIEDHLAWDLAFLASGLSLLVAGRLLIRMAQRQATSPSDTRGPTSL
jgi:uncharacterized membrane protein